MKLVITCATTIDGHRRQIGETIERDDPREIDSMLRSGFALPADPVERAQWLEGNHRTATTGWWGQRLGFRVRTRWR